MTAQELRSVIVSRNSLQALGGYNTTTRNKSSQHQLLLLRVNYFDTNVEVYVVTRGTPEAKSAQTHIFTMDRALA